MILRKLTAAVIASTVMTSGAWAQTNNDTDTATTEVTLEILPQALLSAASQLEFSDNAVSGATSSAGSLCTWTNTNNFTLDVNSDWLLEGDNEGDTISYSLTATNGADTTNFKDETGPFGPSSDGLKLAPTKCVNSTTDFVEITAEILESTETKAADFYRDTVTFTLQAI